MSWTGRAQAKPAPVADRIVTILLLALAGVVFGGYLIVAVSLAAFVDDCPPASCNVSHALTWLVSAGIVSAVALAASTCWGVARLARRRRAWWIAATGLGSALLAQTVGIYAAGAAVGWWG